MSLKIVLNIAQNYYMPMSVLDVHQITVIVYIQYSSIASYRMVVLYSGDKINALQNARSKSSLNMLHNKKQLYRMYVSLNLALNLRIPLQEHRLRILVKTCQCREFPTKVCPYLYVSLLGSVFHFK